MGHARQLPFGVAVALLPSRGHFWGKSLNVVVHLLVAPPRHRLLLLLLFGWRGPLGRLLEELGIVFAFR